MFILFRSVTFNLHDLLCSKKKKSYIWLLWEYLFLYPSFSQWCPLLRCICICFWRSYSFTSHGPTQNCFLLGMSDSLCLFTLEPFNAGHPCTGAWLSMKTCISVVCSYFWYFFLCFSFFVPVCIWFPVYSTESLFLALCHYFCFFLSPNSTSQASLWISVKWNYKVGYTLTWCERSCLVDVT